MICLEMSSILFFFVLVQFVIVKSSPPVSSDSDELNYAINYLVDLERPSNLGPYGRFEFTYNKFSVCELDYDQKRTVCDAVYSLKVFEYKMDSIEHDQKRHNCKRRSVNLGEEFQVTDTKELWLFLYECPNAYKIENRSYNGDIETEKFYIPMRIFIIGGHPRNSVVVGYQHEQRHHPIKLFTVFSDVPLAKLEDLNLMKRNASYKKPSDQLKKFNNLIVKRDPYLADQRAEADDLIRAEPVYSRFLSTYKIINVCALSKKEKLSLCPQVFQASPYKLSISESETAGAMFNCVKRKMDITHSQRTLISVEIASFECPISRNQTPNSFFLGSMLYPASPGLIAFMKVSPFVEIFPDAIITDKSNPLGFI